MGKVARNLSHCFYFQRKASKKRQSHWLKLCPGRNRHAVAMKVEATVAAIVIIIILPNLGKIFFSTNFPFLNLPRYLKIEISSCRLPPTHPLEIWNMTSLLRIICLLVSINKMEFNTFTNKIQPEVGFRCYKIWCPTTLYPPASPLAVDSWMWPAPNDSSLSLMSWGGGAVLGFALFSFNILTEYILFKIKMIKPF